ncbi:MAG: bifunctional phosphopantothenoylcysteine decarboxylase/phosphopantothenate--cysteine ligase CoaBC [Clostridia bacterium]|nr:bifunctional phosphopantothenoylcysteine decarboxylase/phosphopantothenate--cysteine ligase CoaBC [Clostridia bacterium]
MLKDKNIVLGVCGGIAAYKAADLTSKLKKLGANVYVIMTKSATEFVSPLTFRALSQNDVAVSTFDEPKAMEINHISLADRADVFVIAPATANMIGKIACGIADDMLSTTVMATKAPCVIAPAMNTNMYENPIVQENIEKLKKLGFVFAPPRESRLACGTYGVGALCDVEDIIDYIYYAACKEKTLSGKRVMVTAGATREAIDPVRFLTNHSSGKMGFAIAKAACAMGADVTLVSGKAEIKPPAGARVINVVSAEDMYKVCMEEYKDKDIIVKAAAVGDFKAKEQSGNKIKKDGAAPQIELCENPDILESLGKVKENRTLVGFCMETQDLIENAKKKLEKKNADMICANNLFDKGAGFGTDTNTITIIKRGGETVPLPNMSKEDAAFEILKLAATL